MNENTLKRTLKNNIAIYSKNGFDAVVGIVSIAILARYLTLTDFGNYAFILAFVTVFKVLSSMGVETILIREIAKNKNEAVKFYSSGLIILFLLSIITFSVIAIGINLTKSSATVITATYLCALALIFEFIGRLFSSVFQAFEQMKFDAYTTILSKTIFMASIIAIVKLDLGFMSIFYALLLDSLINAGFGFYMVSQRFIKPKFKGSSSEIWFLMKEAIPLGLKRILRKINFRIDTLILAALKSKAEVALFHGIYKIVHDFIFMAESSLQSIFPVFARYYNKDNDSFTLAYEKYFKFLTIIAIPFALFLSSFASEIIKLVLGPKFLSATPALQILGWMITFMFLTNLMERVLIVAGKQRICTVLTMIALSINIIFDFLLIPRWSFVGASIATLVSEIVLMATSFYYVHKLIIKKGVLTEVLKPMGSGIITLIFLYIFRNANFFLTAILGFFLYIIILILTNTFTKEERTILMKALRKAEL